MVLVNSNTIKRLFQNNDLGDLGVNVITRNGTVCLNINTKCRNDPIMLQSPPERDKYFFHRATILFTLPENLNCVYRFTHRISRTRGSKWSHVNPAFGTGWSDRFISSFTCVHNSTTQVLPLWLDGLLQLPRSFMNSFNTAQMFRDSFELPLSAFLDKCSHFFYCFMISMWPN